jgi:hypothetical protein
MKRRVQVEPVGPWKVQTVDVKQRKILLFINNKIKIEI